MSTSQIFDVLIIGGGPAGLSAAYGLARLVHSVLLFDSGVYRNARSSHMHVVPTWDHRNPHDFRMAARRDLLKRYNTTQFVDLKVDTMSKTDAGLFQAIDASGKEWHGRKVILATGVSDIYPDIEGYDQCWSYSIFHCLFCHGYESRGASSAGVLATNNLADPTRAIHVAHQAAQLASSVTIYTHGSNALHSALTSSLTSSKKFLLDNRPIARLEKVGGESSSEVMLHFGDGSDTKKEGFVVHTPFTLTHSSELAEQLGCEMTEGGDLKTISPFGETTVEGAFAAGDCATMVKAVSTAMSLGNLAAAGAGSQIEAATVTIISKVR